MAEGREQRRRRSRRGREPQGLVPDQERRRPRPPHRRHQGRRRRELLDQPRRDARARRRVWLRQDDGRAHDSPPLRADRRQDRLRRQGHHDAVAERDPAAPAPDADGLPGPVRVSQPAPQRREDRRRAPARARPLWEERELESRAGAPRDRRAPRRRGHPLSARVLGRPAAAHRPRALPRAQPRLHRLRRAGLGARRLDPGADHQPAREPAVRLRAHVPLHRPRPRGRPPHLGPDRGHVPRQDRRDLRGRRALRRPAPPVHDLAPLGGADP